MRARGARDGTRAGNVVQYVICKDSGEDRTNAKAAGLASRAYHPEEVVENGALAVDTHYYLSHQLHPVVSRLCAPLDMTSDARLAECLGLDPSSFKRSAPAADKLAAVSLHATAFGAPLFVRCLVVLNAGAVVACCQGTFDERVVLQLDNMLNGASVLDDDDRFADLPALSMVNEAGGAVALPDLTARASWELCCATLREGLSDMQPAQVSNQVRTCIQGSTTASGCCTWPVSRK